MKVGFDVDIDVANREEVLKLFPNHVSASIIKNNTQTKHNTGVYFVDIPKDPVTSTSTIDYKEAEDRGYIKIDLLNVGVYEQVKSEQHLVELMTTDPPWHRLAEKEFTEQLIHVGGHYELVKQKMPDTIPRMAMFLAAMRPAKRHLMNKSWKEMAKTIWDKPKDGQYFFKKSHSLSYSHLVVVHMNLLNGL